MNLTSSSAPTTESDAESNAVATENALRDLYRDFVRPRAARLMNVLALNVIFDKAEGDRMWMTTERGLEPVVDLLGGYGANLLGHHHPEIRAELLRILDRRVPFNAQLSTRPAAALLAAELSRRIAAWTGEESIVHFSNSGAEAVEAAVKCVELRLFRKREQKIKRLELFRERISRGELAWHPRQVVIPAGEPAQWMDQILTRTQDVFGRGVRLMSLSGAYHGKTLGALSVTSSDVFKKPWARWTRNTLILPIDESATWAALIEAELVDDWDVKEEFGQLTIEIKKLLPAAAFFVEPIQGEGGIRPLSASVVEEIHRLAREHDLPIVIDEIQTGLGRTGHFLASEGVGLRGDLFLFSKALGGGLAKIGATAVRRGLYEDDFSMLHTSTFAEDDISAFLALKTLEVIDRDDIAGRCQKAGATFLRRLQRVHEAYPDIIADIRGRGLLLGIEFRNQNENVANLILTIDQNQYLGYALASFFLHQHGFRVAPGLNNSRVLRLEPSAYIDLAHVERFAQALERACEILRRGNTFELLRHLLPVPAAAPNEPIQDFRVHLRKCRRDARRVPKRVGFIAHMTDPLDLKLFDPGTTDVPQAVFSEFHGRGEGLFSPGHYDRVLVEDILGDEVEFHFISLYERPQEIERALRNRQTDALVARVQEGIDIARGLGCQVVGLGGLTSVVTGNGQRVESRGLSLTTGNSLTVAMALEALDRATASRAWTMGDECLSVIGATGNIGSTYALLAARKVGRLQLVGRPLAMGRLQRTAVEILQRLAGETGEPSSLHRALRASPTFRDHLQNQTFTRADFEAIQRELGDASPLVCTTDFESLKDSRLIVAASNSADPILYPEWLHDEAIIVDVAVPADVSPEVLKAKPGVLCLQGGLVRLPRDPNFFVSGVPLARGTAYACMTETLLLGLESFRGHFSCGALETEKIRWIQGRAAARGFTLADFKTEADRGDVQPGRFEIIPT